MTLVDLAVNAKRVSETVSGEVDEYWCVFDVEQPLNHPDLLKAIDKARANGINLAVSNPCFELWLILHHQDCSTWLDNDAARRLRRTCDGSAGKGVSGADYMKSRHRASERAERLDARHQKTDVVVPHNNPSTGMYKLLASVEGAVTRR
jgi:hypothetical protein